MSRKPPSRQRDQDFGQTEEFGIEACAPVYLPTTTHYGKPPAYDGFRDAGTTTTCCHGQRRRHFSIVSSALIEFNADFFVNTKRAAN